MDFGPIIKLPIMRTEAALRAVTAVLLSLGATVAPLAAQSLADVARQEQERRKAIEKPSKVLTNKDLGPAPAAGVPAATTSAPAASDTTRPAAGKDGQPAAADPKTPPAESANGQAYWSGRAKDLQTQLSRNETFAVALQSRINALANEYTNQGDGVRQAAIAADRQKTIDELNRLKKEIEDNKKAVADLQEEARRAGVPPGWLR